MKFQLSCHLLLISDIHVETAGDISIHLTGIGPLNTFGQMVMKDDLKKVSRKVLTTKLLNFLENVMTKISVIDQLYINVAE